MCETIPISPLLIWVTFKSLDEKYPERPEVVEPIPLYYMPPSLLRFQFFLILTGCHWVNFERLVCCSSQAEYFSLCLSNSKQMVGCTWECSLRKLEIKERSWLCAEDPCCISPLTASHQACGLQFEACCLSFLLSEHLCLKTTIIIKWECFPIANFLSVSCSFSPSSC